jgi:hypothetical protein
VEAVPSRVVASPTANLFIEPDGTIHLNSIVENVFSPSFSVLGASFPQTSTPHAAIRDAAVGVATAAFRRKVMGYLSVDFVLYEKTDVNGDRVLRLWAVDLDLYLTSNAAIHNFVALMTNSTYDAESGQCVSENPVTGALSPLTYVYSGLVYNPYIGSIRHASFFQMCRAKGLAFNVQTREGLAFHIVDNLLKGCFGAIAIAPTATQCIQFLFDIQQLIAQELPKDADNQAESNYSFFVSAIKQLMSRGAEKKIDKRRVVA